MTAELKSQLRASCADHNKALSYSGLPLDPLALQFCHKVLLLLQQLVGVNLPFGVSQTLCAQVLSEDRSKFIFGSFRKGGFSPAGQVARRDTASNLCRLNHQSSYVCVRYVQRWSKRALRHNQLGN